MRKVLIFALLSFPLLTSSCVFSNMEKGLEALQGKDIAVAVDVLGYPDKQTSFASDKIYIWSSSFQSTSYVPQTSTTTGYVGNTLVYGQTTSTVAQTNQHSCEIKLGTDKFGIIKNYEYSGTMGGCARASSSLFKYYKSQEALKVAE